MLSNKALDKFMSCVESRYYSVAIDDSTYEDFNSDLYLSTQNLEREMRDNLLNLAPSSQLVYLREIIAHFQQSRDLLSPTDTEITQQVTQLENSLRDYEKPSPSWDDIVNQIALLKALEEYRMRITFSFLDFESDSFGESSSLPINELEWECYKNEQISDTLAIGWRTALNFLKIRTDDPNEVKKLHWYPVDETTEAGSNNISSAPLQWLGSGVELAALFVELDAKGYIRLPSDQNFDRTPWEKICRAITSLFTITTQRKDSKGEPWYNFSRNFVSRAENERTGEIEYHKLHTARHKFRRIVSRVPDLPGSK